MPPFAPTPVAVLSFLLTTAVAVAQIAPGSLVVVRAGDGAFTLTNSAFPTFVDVFDRTTPAQPAPVQSLALPITLAGTGSHGFVTQSADGRYLVVPGYAANPYTALITFTTSVAFPRAIARIALDGSIDDTTRLVDAHSGGGGLPGEIVSAATVDGSSFWTSGTGVASSKRGVCHALLGATTSVSLTSLPSMARAADIVDGQLMASSWFLPFVGVFSIGAGLPTTSGQTSSMLPGMTGSDGSVQPWDFWFADDATVYVADSRTDGAGGIRKWTRSGATWSLQYTLAPSPTTGCRGLSGVRELSGTTLYATTAAISGNQLVAVVDTGPGAAFTTLATAPANTGFRGVRFVRTPYGVSFAGAGCTSSVGVPTIGIQNGPPVAGNVDLRIAVGNTPPVALFVTVVSIGTQLDPVGVPLSLIGAPPCALLHPTTLDLLLADVAFGAGSVPLGLPAPDETLWGLRLGLQNLVWDDVLYAGYGLPFATSPGMQIVIGN